MDCLSEVVTLWMLRWGYGMWLTRWIEENWRIANRVRLEMRRELDRYKSRKGK
jgi:hypothetical protein